jgi:hypothetical protein
MSPNWLVEADQRFLCPSSRFERNVAMENRGAGFRADADSNTFSTNVGCGNAFADAVDEGSENTLKNKRLLHHVGILSASLFGQKFCRAARVLASTFAKRHGIV